MLLQHNTKFQAIFFLHRTICNLRVGEEALYPFLKLVSLIYAGNFALQIFDGMFDSFGKV